MKKNMLSKSLLEGDSEQGRMRDMEEEAELEEVQEAEEEVEGDSTRPSSNAINAIN